MKTILRVWEGERCRNYKVQKTKNALQIELQIILWYVFVSDQNAHFNVNNKRLKMW